MSKRLERDKETAIIAGVMSSLARYFKQDPTLFRLLAIVLLIVTGIFPGVLLYIVAWFMIPYSGKAADYVIDAE